MLVEIEVAQQCGTTVSVQLVRNEAGGGSVDLIWFERKMARGLDSYRQPT